MSIYRARLRNTSNALSSQVSSEQIRLQVPPKLFGVDSWIPQTIGQWIPDFIIALNFWLLDISDFSLVDYSILAVLQEHGSDNILCEMLISWGNVRLTDRRSLFKLLIGGDLSWGHEFWPDVDIWHIWHCHCFTVALQCWSIRFHTLYDVSYKCCSW